MSHPLRFRSGSKFGFIFHVKHADDVEAVRVGGALEGTIVHWSKVAVRTIVKDEWQDNSGQWRDSIRVYVLEPGDEESRLTLDEYYIEGRFKIALRESDTGRVLTLWKEFRPE